MKTASFAGTLRFNFATIFLRLLTRQAAPRHAPKALQSRQIQEQPLILARNQYINIMFAFSGDND